MAVNVYPVILTKGESGFIIVNVPDFDIDTQGKDYAEAIVMARDAIGLMGITWQDKGKELPQPSAIDNIQCQEGEMVTLVDIDFEEYRRKENLKCVRRNVTLPGWLDYKAEEANINVSGVLKKALLQELGIVDKTISQ